MKDLLYFYLATCPHCKQADQDIEQVKKSNPKFANIEFRKIEEKLNPEFASKFDYFNVPCFYVDGNKMLEGDCDQASITKLFESIVK